MTVDYRNDPQPHAVIIVGGGQAGIAAAWGLMREGVRDVLVIDQGVAGFEGPWATFARMPRLRTPKGPTGVDAGHPDLTIQTWYRATHGDAAWENLALIPTTAWMEYLRWIRRVTGIQVRNNIRVTRIVGGSPLLLQCEGPEGPLTLQARKLVWAAGYEGSGRKRIPPIVSAALPRSLYAHSADAIDFERLRGRMVAVVGAGASAFDNAATAAELGAALVHQFVRRPELPRVNLVRWMDFAGFVRNFPDLPDHLRAAYVRRFLGSPMPPPPETLLRVQALANHRLHLGAPLRDLREVDGQVAITTPDGEEIRADLLICGTGFEIDLSLRPEFAGFWSQVKLWRDTYAPAGPRDWVDTLIDAYPYLGDGFQLREREPGSAPWLRDIHVFSSAAVASVGPLGAGINGLKFNICRLVAGLARDLALTGTHAAMAEAAE
jgi:cation diffusion facilitator CzcD-associated flavoprotein CzcO